MQVPENETEYPLNRLGTTVGLYINQENFPFVGKYGALRRASPGRVIARRRLRLAAWPDGKCCARRSFEECLRLIS